MTRILFLHHQQRKHFKEEPGYNEIFNVFKACSLGLELREFVYQTLLTSFLGLYLEKPISETGGRMDYFQAWMESNRALVPILEQVIEIENPDIIINITSYALHSINPAVFSQLKNKQYKFKVATILWDTNTTDFLTMNYLSLSLDHSDIVLLGDDLVAYERFKSKESPDKNLKNIDRLVWLPFVVDPVIYRKLEVQKTRDVAIFGSSEGRRVDMIESLATLFGDRFAHLGGYMKADTYIPIEQYVEEINRTKIIVNTQTIIERDQIKGRIKEVLSCGGFLLEQRTPNTNRFLENSGVVMFDDVGDAYRKILYYLVNESEREKLAKASREWLLNKYSPTTYVETVLGKLNA